MFGGQSFLTNIKVAVATAAAALAAPQPAEAFQAAHQPNSLTAPANPPTPAPAVAPAAAPAHEMVKMTIHGKQFEISNRPLDLTDKADLGILEARIIGKSLADTMKISALPLTTEAFKIGRLQTINLGTDYGIPSLALRDQVGKTIIDALSTAGITGAAIGSSKTAGEFVVILYTANGEQAVIVTSPDLTDQKRVDYQRLMPWVMAEVLKLYGVDISADLSGANPAPGAAGAKDLAPGQPAKVAAASMTPQQLEEALKTAQPYAVTYEEELSGKFPTDKTGITQFKASLAGLTELLKLDQAALQGGQLTPDAKLAIMRLLGIEKANPAHIPEAIAKIKQLNTLAGEHSKEAETAMRKAEQANKREVQEAERAAKERAKQIARDAAREAISPSQSKIEILLSLVPTAYETKYADSLNKTPTQRGIFTTSSTHTKALDKQAAEIDAVEKGTKQDEKILKDARKNGIRADAQAAAVRLGMHPDNALVLNPEQLGGLIAKCDELQIKCARMKTNISKARNGN